MLVFATPVWGCSVCWWVEMGVEELVLNVIFEIFEFGECSKGNKVVVSLEMVLWELLVMEMV